MDNPFWEGFGYVNGVLYPNVRHHAAIMQQLIEGGMTWEELESAPQAWGWIHTTTDSGGNQSLGGAWFTDVGVQNDTVKAEAKKALEEYYGEPVNFGNKSKNFDGEDYGGHAKQLIEENPSRIKQGPMRTSTNPEGQMTLDDEMQRNWSQPVQPDPETLPHGIPSGCFGWVDGKLFLGERHHMAIMDRLIHDFGYTWDTLMKAPQAWGWVWGDKTPRWLEEPSAANNWDGVQAYDITGTPIRDWHYYVQFTSDAASHMEQEAIQRAKATLDNYFGVELENTGENYTAGEYAPGYEQAYGEGGRLDPIDPKKIKQIESAAQDAFSWMVDNDGRFYADFNNAHPGMALELAGYSMDDLEQIAQETKKNEWDVLHVICQKVADKAQIWGFVIGNDIHVGSGTFENKPLDAQDLDIAYRNIIRIRPDAKFDELAVDWQHKPDPWWEGEHTAATGQEHQEVPVGKYEEGNSYKFLYIPKLNTVRVWQDNEYGGNNTYDDPDSYEILPHFTMINDTLERAPKGQNWWSYQDVYDLAEDQIAIGVIYYKHNNDEEEYWPDEVTVQLYKDSVPKDQILKALQLPPDTPVWGIDGDIYSKVAGMVRSIAYIDGQLYTGQNHLFIAQEYADKHGIEHYWDIPRDIPQIWGWVLGNAREGYHVEWFSDTQEEYQNFGLAEDAFEAAKKWWNGGLRDDLEYYDFGPDEETRAEMAEY